jgi:kinesin family protein 5
MSRDTIKVAARFRPLNKREVKQGANELQTAISEGLPGGDKLEISFGGRRQEFSFDLVFGDAAQQDNVYDRAAKASVDNLFAGYNGTIFAYGQTGSGKTHSMYGPANMGEHCGIVPRAVLHIFDHMSEEQGHMVEEFSVRCAFCELYNENINDLLDASKKNLAIRESPSKGIYIADLTWEYAGSEEDIFEFLELGQRNRKTASTDMNETSSRSHSIFQLELTQKRSDGTTRVARLSLVDLAGSESVKKTNATGQTFDEAKKINLSLSALGNCIKALTTKGEDGHIPYRDSKLTRVLQESLGGNSKTTLLVCLSPHHDNFEETLSTLRFAQRAKQIVTRARVNERQSPEMMQKTIEALRHDIRVVTRAYADVLAWLAKEHPEIEVPERFKRGAATGAGAEAGGDGGGGGEPGERDDNCDAGPRREGQWRAGGEGSSSSNGDGGNHDGDDDSYPGGGFSGKSSTEQARWLS